MFRYFRFRRIRKAIIRTGSALQTRYGSDYGSTRKQITKTARHLGYSGTTIKYLLCAFQTADEFENSKRLSIRTNWSKIERETAQIIDSLPAIQWSSNFYESNAGFPED